MTTPTTIVEATLQPDGMTLHLATKLALPPGRVTVTVQPTGPATGPTMLDVLDRIRHDQQQQGHRYPTEEEMVAEIAEMRADDDEYEEHCRKIWSQTGSQAAEGGIP